jgi:hypothetical protein
MSKLSDIRAGIKTVVEAALTDFTVYVNEPDHPKEYPCLVIHPVGDLNYVRTPRIDDTRFNVLATLYIDIRDMTEMEDKMDEYRSATGTESLRAAVKTDDTLNGSVTYAEVITSTQPERGVDNGDDFWEYASTFEINVIKNDP